RSGVRLHDVAEMIDFWARYTLDKIFDTPPGWQTQNMLLVAALVARSALWRAGSPAGGAGGAVWPGGGGGRGRAGRERGGLWGGGGVGGGDAGGGERRCVKAAEGSSQRAQMMRTEGTEAGGVGRQTGARSFSVILVGGLRALCVPALVLLAGCAGSEQTVRYKP